jgi:hypothetical protein
MRKRGYRDQKSISAFGKSARLLSAQLDHTIALQQTAQGQHCLTKPCCPHSLVFHCPSGGVTDGSGATQAGAIFFCAACRCGKRAKSNIHFWKICGRWREIPKFGVRSQISRQWRLMEATR